MKKVLILGVTGMAGHIVHDYLCSTKKYDVYGVSFRTKLNDNTEVIDVRNHEKLSKYILELKPDVIVNCVGVLIREASSSPENAIYLNSYFPHALSSISKSLGARLIHISTDCVFSGKKGEYTERSVTDALDIYGRSKMLGELTNSRDLTIRTSIIGPELKESGEGLLHWFFKQNQVNGYSCAFWSGVTTLELAKAIEYYTDNEECGLVNLTNGQKISKYNLLRLVVEIFDLSIVVDECPGKFVDKSLKSIYHDFYEVGSYQSMLTELRDWMMLHKTVYEAEYPSVYSMES